MRFEITILGSGAGLPTLQRNAAGQVINLRENYFLVDCGENTQLQLRKYGLRYQRIDHIFISHLHADHYLGLPGLLFSMQLLGRTRELHLYAHKNIMEIVRVNCEVSQTRLQYPLHFHELQAEGVHLLLENKAVQVYSFPLKHRIACNGFLFKEKVRLRHIDKQAAEKYGVPGLWMMRIKEGEDYVRDNGEIIPNSELTLPPDQVFSYAYCSDTKYHEPLIDVLKEVDVIYHEATFAKDMPDRARETMHSTTHQAATIASKAGVKKLVIGHFSARYRGHEELVAEAREIFPNTEAATDGCIIKIY